MRRQFIILMFVATTTLLACAGEEATSRLVTKPSPRLSGPVSLSLQNEINAAVDRGRTWLISQQNADGSFGTISYRQPDYMWRTNVDYRIEFTSVATLALLHNATSNELAAATKAANWLAKENIISLAKENAAFTEETEEWRKLALLTAGVPDQYVPPTNSVRSPITPIIGPNPFCGMLCREVRHQPASTNRTVSPKSSVLYQCLIGMPTTPTPITPTGANALSLLANSWPNPLDATNKCQNVQYSRACQYWIFARFINRAGGGTLADAQGKIVDWRNDLAQKMVDSQTSATGGKGGFWQDADAKSWTGQPIAATAFALLALDEL